MFFGIPIIEKHYTEWSSKMVSATRQGGSESPIPHHDGGWVFFVIHYKLVPGTKWVGHFTVKYHYKEVSMTLNYVKI